MSIVYAHEVLGQYDLEFKRVAIFLFSYYCLTWLITEAYVSIQMCICLVARTEKEQVIMTFFSQIYGYFQFVICMTSLFIFIKCSYEPQFVCFEICHMQCVTWTLCGFLTLKLECLFAKMPIEHEDLFSLQFIRGFSYFYLPNELRSTMTYFVVVVQGKRGLPALDADTFVFLEGQQLIGQIFETFGPVPAPFYSVRFNKVNRTQVLLTY